MAPETGNAETAAAPTAAIIPVSLTAVRGVYSATDSPQTQGEVDYEL